MESMPESGPLALLAKWLEKEEEYRRTVESDNVIHCGTPASPDSEGVLTTPQQGTPNYMLNQYVATPTSSQRGIRRRRLNFGDPAYVYELEDISGDAKLAQHSIGNWDEVEDMVFIWMHELPANSERCAETQAKFEPTLDGEEACMEFARH